MSEHSTLSSACRAVLEQGSLEAKLAPFSDALVFDRAEPLDIATPVRCAELALQPGAGRLPRPRALSESAARATCLARFAHHELQAVELFAWALLRWPDLDPGLRGDFTRILGDEQRHCRLYLARLAAHGSSLADHALSDYFWKQLPTIRSAPAGPAAFLSAMGLTLEQANLDFTLLYRDAFREAGDEASARVCQTVHDEEIGHVRSANHWLRELLPDPNLADDAARYAASVPFPLGPARAKGRRFDPASRRRAGLDEALIELVRSARSNSERPPAADDS